MNITWTDEELLHPDFVYPDAGDEPNHALAYNSFFLPSPSTHYPLQAIHPIAEPYPATGSAASYPPTRPMEYHTQVSADAFSIYDGLEDENMIPGFADTPNPFIKPEPPSPSTPCDNTVTPKAKATRKKKAGGAKGKASQSVKKPGKKQEKAAEPKNEEVDELDEDGPLVVKAEPGDGDALPKKKKAKKVGTKLLIATKPVWSDLPDWQGRDVCPIMTLPAEVLDFCFKVGPDISARDYVALAGVCSFFRHHLDDAFFKALRGAKRPIKIYAHTFLPPRIEYQYDAQVAAHPFTRNIAAWRVPRPLTSIPPPVLPVNIIPSGPRDTWSQEEYEGYKLAKSKFRKRAKKTVRAQWEVVAARARLEAHNLDRVERNGTTRKVKANVVGRLDGEHALEKDDRGYPIEQYEPAELFHGRSPTAKATGTTATAMTEAMESGKKRGREVGLLELPEAPAKKKREKPRKNKGEDVGKGNAKRKQKWTARETDDESDIDPSPIFDGAGKYKPHHYWPSRHRRLVSEMVNETRIGKTEALTSFKIKEAELITLKHVYVHNPLNPKHHQQLFVEAAVEALAFRAHGGVDGHTAHMEAYKKRCEKLAETRDKKIEDAKANGTHVPKVRKTFVPPWEHAYFEPLSLFLGGYWDY